MQLSLDGLRTSSLRLQSEVHFGIADLKNDSARFAEFGSGEPLLVAPGLAGGMELILPLVRELAKYRHVIVFESRGERDSFALRRRFGMEELADDLAEFVQWRGLESPDLLGISFGGVVGMIAAARNPHMFSSISLQGCGARFEFGLIQRVASLVLASYPLPEDCPFLNQFFGVLFGGRPTPEQLDYAVRSCWLTDQCVIMHRLRLLKRTSMERVLPRVRVPALIVSGARDSVVSRANARSLADGLKDARHVIVPGSGHLAPLSHTAIVAGAVVEFLAKVPAC